MLNFTNYDDDDDDRSNSKIRGPILCVSSMMLQFQLLGSKNTTLLCFKF